jgi:hypothetical protein
MRPRVLACRIDKLRAGLGLPGHVYWDKERDAIRYSIGDWCREIARDNPLSVVEIDRELRWWLRELAAGHPLERWRCQKRLGYQELADALGVSRQRAYAMCQSALGERQRARLARKGIVL